MYSSTSAERASLGLIVCISVYNQHRPHQALGMKTLAMAYALVA